MMLLPLILLAAASTGGARGAAFEFPTDNRAILEGKPSEFFMYVNRDFEGERSSPWEGGQFGFVRGPQRTSQGVVYTSLHEGIDIRPVRRDAAGNPLDDVRAAAAGVVVHGSTAPGASNYGRYVVVEHRKGPSRFYTLYAHLATVDVQPGQAVRQGEVLGRMGYSGVGLDRTRAHLHFEVAMLLSQDFQQWYDRFQGGSPNLHGNFNGMNLVGTDPTAVLKAAARDSAFDLARHIQSLEPFYKVTVPNPGNFGLLREYPWLVPAGEDANPPAWTISFTATGVPVRVVAALAVSEPRVDWVRPTTMAYSHATRGIVGGSAGSPRLTESGQRFIRLVTWPG